MRIIGILALFALISPTMLSQRSSAFQETTVYSCSMHPEVTSSKPGVCPKCSMKLTAGKPVAAKPEQQVNPAPTPPTETRTVEAVKGREEYTCSMHPDIRTYAAGKCPKCAMTLVPVVPAVPDDFNLRVESTPKDPKPNQKVKLRLSVFNPKTGEQVKQFNVTHDKLYHLFVVSQDLSEFQHIHPDFQPDGSFIIETVLPISGSYKIYSDFYPQDGAAQVLQKNIATAGYKEDLLASEPVLQPDTNLVRTADGIKVELTLEPAKIIAGQPVTLKYRLTDEKTGQPVRDLVPYLGAWGHTLILSSDQQDYVHSHPEETIEDSEGKPRQRGGPDVTFNAFMPRPGIYRIWTQFQRGERLSTYSFTVRAEQLR